MRTVSDESTYAENKFVAAWCLQNTPSKYLTEYLSAVSVWSHMRREIHMELEILEIPSNEKFILLQAMTPSVNQNMHMDVWIYHQMHFKSHHD